MTKIFYLIQALLFVLTANIHSQEDPGEHKGYKVEGKELADGTLYGNDIDGTQQVVKISDIFSNLEGSQNKTFVVEGTLTEVCQAMGCWTVITDGTNTIRAQTLHKYFLPKDIPSGSKVIVAGEFEIKEITEDQAKHFAEESGKSTDDIKGPQKMYRIKATGIKVLK